MEDFHRNPESNRLVLPKPVLQRNGVNDQHVLPLACAELFLGPLIYRGVCTRPSSGGHEDEGGLFRVHATRILRALGIILVGLGAKIRCGAELPGGLPLWDIGKCTRGIQATIPTWQLRGIAGRKPKRIDVFDRRADKIRYYLGEIRSRVDRVRPVFKVKRSHPLQRPPFSSKFPFYNPKQRELMPGISTAKKDLHVLRID